MATAANMIVFKSNVLFSSHWQAAAKVGKVPRLSRSNNAQRTVGMPYDTISPPATHDPIYRAGLLDPNRTSLFQASKPVQLQAVEFPIARLTS